MATTTINKQFDTAPQSYDNVIVERRPRALPITSPVPVVINTPYPSGSCSCTTGSGFEQKIKENPLLFVLGALAIGYLLAKNH